MQWTFYLPKSLGQLEGFSDDALLFVVVAHLDVPGEREVLAEWVTLEAVVRQYAPQVRMALELLYYRKEPYR